MSITVAVELTPINCGTCGGTYAINERYRQQKYEKSGTWTCPYCKTNWGYTEGEVDRLKKQLAQEKHKAEQKEALLREQFYAERAAKERTERRRAAMKGQLTRVRNRVGKGVCPCCNRTFINLQRHMEKKHADWAPEVEAETVASE